METQDYAFQPGLTVGELLKSSQKDWQAAINHRFVKELFLEIEIRLYHLLRLPQRLYIDFFLGK